jgi:hypothetical protein
MKLLHTPMVKLEARSPGKIKSAQVAKVRVVINESGAKVSWALK